MLSKQVQTIESPSMEIIYRGHVDPFMMDEKEWCDNTRNDLTDSGSDDQSLSKEVKKSDVGVDLLRKRLIRQQRTNMEEKIETVDLSRKQRRKLERRKKKRLKMIERASKKAEKLLNKRCYIRVPILNFT